MHLQGTCKLSKKITAMVCMFFEGLLKFKTFVLVQWMIDRWAGGPSLLSGKHRDGLEFTQQMQCGHVLSTTSECFGSHCSLNIYHRHYNLQAFVCLHDGASKRNG